MMTICKRELRACFHTPVGGIFTAFLLLIGGILAYLYSFDAGYARMEYVLLGAQYALIVAIPFLVIARRSAERRGGDDLLLRTLPVSPAAVTWGRYLAHVAVLALPCAVFAVYPVIYSLYGDVNYVGAYTSLAVFFLLGCLLIALCRLIATLCRRAWLAALISVATILLLYFLPTIADLIPASPAVSKGILCALTGGVAGGIAARTRRPVVAGVVAAVLFVPLTVWQILSPESFEGLFGSILIYFSPFMHFQQAAAYNFFDLSAVVMLISTSVVLVLLTLWVTIRPKDTLPRRPLFLTPAIRRAAVLGLSTVVLMGAVNIGAWNLPAKYSFFDTSGLGITDLTEDSRGFLRGMDEDVTLYWVCADGVTDNSQSLLLTRYAEESEHLSISILDPTTDADVLARYTDETLPNYSFIVAGERRERIVKATDLYYYTNSLLDEAGTYRFTYAEMSYYVSYYISLYGQAVEAELAAATKSYFNGEAVLTSAMDYVTADTVPQGYILTGHGAVKPSEALMAQWGVGDVIPTELDLGAADAVPADANCLILFAPTEDITEHEAALIEDYMDRGGSFLLVTSPACVTRCPRAMALGERFGLTARRGTVADPSASGHYGDSYYYISPTVSSQHGITYSLSAAGYAACLPNAHAILVGKTDGVTSTALMTTSSSGQLMVNGLGAGAKEILTLAVTSSKTVQVDGDQKTAMFTWFGSADAFTDAVNTTSKEGNYNYLTMAILWMSQPFSSRYATIPADCIDTSYLTVANEGVALLWGVMLALVLPGAVLTGSIAVWRRRKRA